MRLMDATSAIVGSSTRFAPSHGEIQNILAAGHLAKRISSWPSYQEIESRLQKSVAKNRQEILRAAESRNVNLRGNQIEQIITESSNAHRLEDLSFELEEHIEVFVDVKTKLLDLASSPKGYNVDKFLKLVARGNRCLTFFFVGIDPRRSFLGGRLVSVLDKTILEATRIQFHWAGRNSRGVTQLTEPLLSLFEDGFAENFDTDQAEKFMKKLLDL